MEHAMRENTRQPLSIIHRFYNQNIQRIKKGDWETIITWFQVLMGRDDKKETAREMFLHYCFLYKNEG